MCLLFSLHVTSHVCSLPLCCIPKVTAGLDYRGSCLKAGGLTGLLSSEVCGQRFCLHIDSDQNSTSCFFDEYCLDKVVCGELLSILIKVLPEGAREASLVIPKRAFVSEDVLEVSTCNECRCLYLTNYICPQISCRPTVCEQTNTLLKISFVYTPDKKSKYAGMCREKHSEAPVCL